MGVNIVILDNTENFIQFLDPELCEATESISENGLRSLKLEYKFQDAEEDKELFKIGNKIWISGDKRLKDCLYIINTKVETDFFDENCFTLEVEEVLVELNNAPIFTQNEITTQRGFTYNDTNGVREVTVDFNALNYWFGKYFNIGVIQQVTTGILQNITVSGTTTRMDLLRYIEECTGNVFVTRYEKDILTNTIHRYLDFLNPTTVKPWSFNIEYDFIEDEGGDGVFDSEGNPSDDKDELEDDEDEDLLQLQYDQKYTLAADDTIFRICDENFEVISTEDGEELSWEAAEDVGLTDGNNAVVKLSWDGTAFGVSINQKSYAVIDDDDTIMTVSALEEINDDTNQNYDPTHLSSLSNGYVTTWVDPSDMKNAIIPDDCYFEIYDSENDIVVFRTQINYILGHVHAEILNFGSNVENVEYEVDETNTVKAVSPLLSLSDNNNNKSNSLSRTDMNAIINAWKNLEVEKGEIIPLTLEKFNIQGSTVSSIVSNTLGTKNVHNNYYARPKKPNDNKTADKPADYTYEFYRATSYTRSPFTKYKGDLYVRTELDTGLQYDYIHTRADISGRDEGSDKMGAVSTNEEDPYMIFNAVCTELKENMYPGIDLDVDVVNLKNNELNNYDIYDKVYIKLPNSKELVTARVTQTSKDAHDIAKNTIKLSNYSINNITKQNMTYIDADNVGWRYPSKQKIYARLENADYDSEDQYSVQHLANQMLTFRLYKIENGQNTLYKVYNKITNSQGYGILTLKLDPGKYELGIVFGGDEHYLDSDLTIKLTVAGVKEKKPTTKKTKAKVKKATTKSKTTKKSYKHMAKVYRYYDKYGRSPDMSTIRAVGKRSAGRDPGSDKYYYETVFKNYCPYCGRSSLVWGIWWAGKHKNKGYFTFPSGKKSKEGGSAEGHIFCTHCDADYSIFGYEHKSGGKKLHVVKKYTKSKASRATKLKSGKYIYDYYWVKQKFIDYGTKRIHSDGIPNSLIKRANAIVGNRVGTAAAMKIAEWCAKNVEWVDYPNFRHSATWVNRNKRGNCCDQTRLMLALMDAAGCLQYLKLEFVHVVGGKGGHIFAKVTTRSTGRSRVVDPCKSSGHWWGGYVHGYGSLPGRRTKYHGWNQIKTKDHFFIN